MHHSSTAHPFNHPSIHNPSPTIQHSPCMHSPTIHPSPTPVAGVEHCGPLVWTTRLGVSPPIHSPTPSSLLHHSLTAHQSQRIHRPPFFTHQSSATHHLPIRHGFTVHHASQTMHLITLPLSPLTSHDSFKHAPSISHSPFINHHPPLVQP